MMRNKTDNESLLDDVFAADFRETMLDETLRLVRHRRRQTRNVAGIFAALALLGIFVWQKNLPQKTIVVSAPSPVAKITFPKNYELIRTQPFSAGAIVTTHSLVTGKFIASVATIEVVQTTTGNYRVIDDDELLALLASHPAILVRTGKNSEE